MFERRYFKYFLFKRKYDRQGDKRFLRFDIEELLILVLKYRLYRINRERIVECFFNEVMFGYVFSGFIIFYVREFCDEEQFLELQLFLVYIFQSISQLEYINSIVGNESFFEFEYFFEISGNMFDLKEILIEKEYQIYIQLCNSDFVKFKNYIIYSIRDIVKECNFEDKIVFCESNLVYLSFIKENISYSLDKSYDLNCKVNIDIYILVLGFKKKYILSVDIYE